MLRFRYGMALAILIAVLLTGCGGEGGADTGAGLVAPPTRTPLPVMGDAAEHADSAAGPAPGTTTPQVHLENTRFGLDTALALAWSEDGARLLVSGGQHGWAYDAALDAAPEPLDTSWHSAGTFSPDGKLIAARGGNGLLALWDTTTDTRLFALEQDGERAWRITFSPDGARAAAVIMPAEAVQAALDASMPTVEYDPANGIVPDASILRVWEIDSGAATEYGLPGVRVLAIGLPDDGRVLLATSGNNVTRYEWDRPNQPVRVIPPTSSDTSIQLWDVAAPEAALATLGGIPSGAPSATLSPDGRTLAAPAVVDTSAYGTNEWRLFVWDTMTSDLLHELDADSVGAYTLRAFSPDGTIFAAVVNARDDIQATPYTFDQVWLWHVTTGELIAVLWSDVLTGEYRASIGIFQGNEIAGDRNQVQAIDFSADGARLAALGSDGTVVVWDTALSSDAEGDTATSRAPSAVRADFTGRIVSAALDSAGSTLYASSTGNVMRAWDVASAQPAAPIVVGQQVMQLAGAPNNLLIGSVARTLAWIQVWDTSTNTTLGVLRNMNGSLRFMALHPDGTRIATARGGGTLSIWDVASGSVVDVLLATHPVTALAYSPDGTQLATGGMDGTLKLWDLTSGEEIASISAHSAVVTHLAFSADAKTLTSASVNPVIMEAERFGETTIQADPDYTVRQWNLESWTQRAALDLSGDTPPTLVALSADGARVATITPGAEGGTALVVHVLGQTQPLVSHALDTAPVTALSFSLDGAQVVTGHADGTLTLWQIIMDD